MAKKFYNGKKGSGFANLPQDSSFTEYPAYPCGGKEGYDDTMSGIDKKMHKDNKANNRANKTGRW